MYRDIIRETPQEWIIPNYCVDMREHFSIGGFRDYSQIQGRNNHVSILPLVHRIGL
jgi:hypothetical protein